MTDSSTPDSGSDRRSAPGPVGIIGGSGFYSLVAGGETIRVSTPFGEPSDEVTVGEYAGRRVAFLPRHGAGHRHPAHRVNYRANLWALRSLGVRQVLAPCAVGSLDADQGPGTIVVPDQVIDRTWGRSHTVYDEAGSTVHTGFADPYCPVGRRSVIGAAEPSGVAVADGGTMVVINGPRFSTRAESRWHAVAGGTLVGMTGMPEASIARELALCYTSVALVTDLDAGVEEGSGVNQAEVFAQFGRTIEELRTLLGHVLSALPAEQPDCGCRHALDGMDLPFELP